MTIPDQIGSYAFTSTTGDLSPTKPKLQNITRDGVPGIAYRICPNHGEERTLTTVAFVSTDVEADALISDYTALMATVTTIVWRDMTYSNFFVTDVTVTDRKLVFTPGGYAWRVSATWKVISNANS